MSIAKMLLYFHSPSTEQRCGKETFYLHQTRTEFKHLERRIYKVGHVGCPDDWEPLAVVQHRVIAGPGAGAVLQTFVDQNDWERDLQDSRPLGNIKRRYLEHSLSKTRHKTRLTHEAIVFYLSYSL